MAYKDSNDKHKINYILNKIDSVKEKIIIKLKIKSSLVCSQCLQLAPLNVKDLKFKSTCLKTKVMNLLQKRIYKSTSLLKKQA